MTKPGKRVLCFPDSRNVSNGIQVFRTHAFPTSGKEGEVPLLRCYVFDAFFNSPKPASTVVGASPSPEPEERH